MDDHVAISYLRNRRATYFFGDAGPSLPTGLAARWRLSPSDPRGWQANMVGFIEGPPDRLGEVLDTAMNWFTPYGVDAWVDVDEYGVLFRHQELIDSRGFRLNDDWDAMLCRGLVRPELSSRIDLRFVQDKADILTAAWITEQTHRREPVTCDDAGVQRRMTRYWREHTDRQSSFVVATLDGQPAGTARVTNEELPVIVGVVTLPTARGRGVATAVTAALALQALAEQGACALYAERGSQAARIYRRLGFVPLFRMRTWVRPYVPIQSSR